MKVIQWTYAKTYSDAPHEYVTRQTAPDAFDFYREKIRTEGVREKFTLRGKTATYRYFYAGGYKYWIVGVVLNRTHVG